MSAAAGDRLERIREVLELATDCPEPERAALVLRLCAGDEELRREAESLLRALGRAGHLLEPETPAAPARDLAGLTVGPYKVADRIGAGGMGVVYRAQDRRLGRTVALKSLPLQLALDPVRWGMIEREARMLAALNHPNIAAIYGVEPSEHGPILALEFVEGPTLAEVLARGAMNPEDARGTARQILLALEAAHDAGIIHRDIKPSNVKLTPKGGVKVLDFGIAKAAAMGPQSGGTATQGGRPIGTPAYMSPEQARGRPVDRRTDMWSFGCVLFEMFTGCPAFRGETATDTIAAVLRSDPEWARLPPWATPPEHRLLRRCLEKAPEKRLRDAADARLELEEGTADDAAIGAGPERRWRGRVVAAAAGAALLGGLGLGALVYRMSMGATEAPPVARTRMTIDLPAGMGLTADKYGGCLSVSPDGRAVAYAAGTTASGSRLFVRRMDAFEAEEIPGTRGGIAPCFSPDGKWLVYGSLADTEDIRKVRLAGGAPVVLATAPGSSTYGVCWTSSDSIILCGLGTGGLWRVGAAGGAPEPITEPKALHELSHIEPADVPGTDIVLFTCLRLEGDRVRKSIEAVTLGTRHRQRLLDDACQVRCIGSGTLLFNQGDAIMSVGFDAERLAITGEPRRVLSPIAGGELVPRMRYAVSPPPACTLAYLPSPVTYDETDLVWAAPGVPQIAAFRGTEFIDSLRLSPDGRKLAFAAGGRTTDVRVLDLARGTTTKLTDGSQCFYPIWTPDGERVVFKNEVTGRIEMAAPDGTSAAEPLFKAPDGRHCYPNAFTPDGKTLIFTMAVSPGGAEDLYTLGVGADEPPQPLFPPAPARLSRFAARLCPDGTLISYTTEESGEREVCLQPFPSLNRKIVVSPPPNGGFRSVWSGDGKTLFYRVQDRLYGVEVSTNPGLAVSLPRLIMEHLPESRYDVAPDGTRFIIAQSPGGAGIQTRINVMLNGAAELGLDGAAAGR